ncbi:reverse transcriptase domain-containing protein [Tanacetum coccineum]
MQEKILLLWLPHRAWRSHPLYTDRGIKNKKKGKLPEDPIDARTLMENIGNCTIEDGVLYRKFYLVPLMKCIGPLQANYVIKEVHMGSCGMHVGIDKLDWIKLMKPVWKSLSVESPAATIIINNETQFVNYPFAEKLKIQLISTSVYHPKGNGAVERANRSLLRGIKTKMKLRRDLDLLEERKEIAAIREARLTPTNVVPMVKLMPLVVRLCLEASRSSDDSSTSGLHNS